MLQKGIGAVAKISKSSSSDMEIEIAELLYGLMTSKNHESSSQKLETTINHNTSTDAAGGFDFLKIFSLFFACVFVCLCVCLD